MTPTEQQREFFRLARSGPGYLAWQKRGGDFRQSWFATETDALAMLIQHAADSNIWVSMSEFPTRTLGRSAKGAERQSSFWIDVDAHEGGRYANPKAVSDALLHFLDDTALPKPSIIHLTGHGVHAIWSFDPPLLKCDWLPLAEKLQQLADHHQLDADPITADAARILRVPGTTNFRNPGEPKPTTMRVRRDGRVNIEQFVAALNTAHAELPLEVLKPKQKASPTPFEHPATPENVAILNGMLACIDPDPGDTKTRVPWRNTIWAIAATGWTQAFESARDWSAKGDLWDETKFLNVWDSFDRDHQDGIGFGTLVHRAKEGGYTGPWMKAGTEPITASDAPTPRSTGGLITQLASEIEPESVEWLIQDAIPLGTLVVIGGQPGLGKSQLAIKLVAAVTTGNGLPDGEPVERIGSVIILANEDDAARTIRPRLEAAGADLSKVHIVQGVVRG